MKIIKTMLESHQQLTRIVVVNVVRTKMVIQYM